MCPTERLATQLGLPGRPSSCAMPPCVLQLTLALAHHARSRSRAGAAALTAVSTCGGRVGRSDGRREWNSSTEAVSSPREAHLPPPRSFPTKPAASTDHYCILPRAPTRCPERATAPKARPRWRLRAGASSRPACARAAAPVWLEAGGVAAGWRAVHLGGAPVSCSCSGRARRVGDRRIVPRGRALPRPDESALMSADEH